MQIPPIDLPGNAQKVEIINHAYSELRISGVTRNPTPGELELALRKLESLAAQWYARNITIDYNFEETPDPNSDLGCPRHAWEALSTNLAVIMIPDFNKPVPDQLYRSASSAYSVMVDRNALEKVRETEYPRTMPRGSGSTLRLNRWAAFYRSLGNVLPDPSTEYVVSGDVVSRTIHFDTELKPDETITNVEFSADSGLELVASGNDDNSVNYQIRVTVNESTIQQLTLIVTTSLNNVFTRFRYFEVASK